MAESKNVTDTKNIIISLNQRSMTMLIDEGDHIECLHKTIAGFIYYFKTYTKSAPKN